VIQGLLEQIFDQHISSIETVSGGDINNAYCVKLDNKQVCFVKHNTYANGDDMLYTERISLEYLSAYSPFNIPSVLQCSSINNDHFLVLDFITEGHASKKDYFSFGQKLAMLHKTTQDNYGFFNDNYIGTLHQKNDLTTNWKDFYINNRLRYQLELAIESGILSSEVLDNLDAIDRHWDTYIPEEKASLLHGDLWSGNYLVTKTGEITIIDPAVYYGHREVDIAMTQIFGGFPQAFYDGYQNTYPLEEGYEQRQCLYQLYPMLVHTNIFGGSYTTQTMQLLNTITTNWT